MDDDDPVTGRRMLTRSAYADGRNLRSRLAIWARETADPRWRTSFVDWDGTQVVADVGCGTGFDLRWLVPERRCRRAIGLDLSAGMLRSLEDLRSSGRLSLVQADAQRLPLCDGGADVALAMHMLYHVSDARAAVRELRRIVRRGGTVLASANSTGTLTEIHGLVDAAVSELLGRPVRALPPVSFTTETGTAIMESEFPDVTLHRHEATLAFPEARPVLAYLDSVREPIMRHVGERFDFDAALDDIAARVKLVIRAHGRFRVTSRSGVFVCR